MDKSLKDLQQAIYTSAIVNNKEMRQMFSSLPKKWQQAIFRSLKKSEEQFPLSKEDVDKLKVTLQGLK